MLSIARRLLPLLSLSIVITASAKAQTTTTPQQTLKIVTIAGSIYQGGDSGDGGLATNASLSSPYSVRLDQSGNIFILDDNGIRKVTIATGIISTVQWPQQAPLQLPVSIAVDPNENIYVTEGFFACDLRELVAASGSAIVLAGAPFQCDSTGDGGPAIDALVNPIDGDPPYMSGSSLFTDRYSNLYFSEYTIIRKITAATGIITSIAGGGADYSDGVYATQAALSPNAITVDNNGNLYVVDGGNNRVRRVDVTTRLITTVAGNGTAGFAGDGGLAINAQLSGDVEGIAVDRSGNLYISDTGNARIREVAAATGIITTIAGTGSTTVSGDNGPAIDAGLGHPASLVVNAAGSLFVGDYVNGVVREISVSPYQFGRATLTPGISPVPFGPFDSPQTITITDNDPGAVIYYTTDGSAPTVKSTLYTEPFTLSTSATISAIAVAPGFPQSAVATSAYTFVAPPTQLPAPQFSLPGGTYSTTPLQVFITDALNGVNIFYSTDGQTPSILYNPSVPITIRSTTTLKAVAELSGNAPSNTTTAVYDIVTPPSKAPEIVTVAGTSGTAGFSGDGMVATAATLNGPNGVAVNKAGDIFISDATNGVIRKVSEATGIITTLPGITSTPGTAQYGETGNTGPSSVAVDASGNIYLADSSPFCDIRKVDALTGAVTTIAGLGFECGDSGDGGLALNATLGGSASAGLATDLQGNVYISDPGAQVVRKITVATGIISRVAGMYGRLGFAGDGGPATSAELSAPSAIAVDINGNLYIADTGNNRIRKVNISTRIISTVAGNGTPGFSGDGGPATAAKLSGYKDGLAVDRSGNIYIADSSSARIREVSAATGIISTIAGTGSSLDTGDHGPALQAAIGHPGALAVDASGSVFFVDPVYNVVREVSVTPEWYSNPSLPPNFSPNGGGFFTPQQVTITATQAGSIIYYTTDGSTPTTRSTVYTGPITVSATETISAIAMAPNLGPSPVTQAFFTIASATVAAPQFSPAGGSFSAPVSVTISDTTTTAQIYYTTDGSTPTSSSSLYTGPILISSPITLNAIAVVFGQAESGVATAVYNVHPVTVTVAAPSIYPAPGTYDSPQTVVITDIMAGATIYYTTGAMAAAGATPFKYTGPLLLTQTDTISAYAVVQDTTSATTSESYTVNLPTTGIGFPSLSPNLTYNGVGAVGGPNYKELIVLQLMDNTLNSAHTVWSSAALNVTAFTSDFTFETDPANGGGFTFALQNQGVNAVGQSGAGLGYEGIGTSVALKFDFTNDDGEGIDSTGLYLNGAAPTVPSTDLTPSGINLHSTTVKRVHLMYDGTTLTVTITDPTTGASATQSYKVDIPSIVGGNSAYVGFTAGTGSRSAHIVIESWNFTPTVSMAAQLSPTPVILPASGTFPATHPVSIVDVGSGAVIHYTVDGSAPSSTSPVYTVPLTVAAGSTVKAIAIVPGYAASETITATYSK